MDRAEALRKRQAMRLTQAELAKAMGVAISVVKVWEAGGRFATYHQRHLKHLHWRWESDPTILDALIKETGNGEGT